MDQLLSFLSAVEEDPRITTAHISLFAALWKKWKDSGNDEPLSFFRCDLTNLSKVGMKRFHSAIRELHEYGYIRYEPSFDQYKGSLVYFISSYR